MAGAWEVQHHGTVGVCILHTDVVSMAWALGLKNLQFAGGVLPVAGQPFDMARNSACMKVLEAGLDYCFFLDSDVVPPRDAIQRLMRHDVPLISGVYARRSPPHAIPVMLKGGRWLAPDEVLPSNGVIEVDLVGAGCMLIRRDLLEQLKPLAPEVGKHWFDWRVDRASKLPPGEALSEDFAFCVAVKRQLGIPTLVDCSVVCRHVGLAQALPGVFEPCEATPNT